MNRRRLAPIFKNRPNIYWGPSRSPVSRALATCSRVTPSRSTGAFPRGVRNLTDKLCQIDPRCYEAALTEARAVTARCRCASICRGQSSAQSRSQPNRRRVARYRAAVGGAGRRRRRHRQCRAQSRLHLNLRAVRGSKQRSTRVSSAPTLMSSGAVIGSSSAAPAASTAASLPSSRPADAPTSRQSTSPVRNANGRVRPMNNAHALDPSATCVI